MAERNWQDEIEPYTKSGKRISLAVWCKVSKKWMCIVVGDNEELLYSDNTIPKQKPKKYRPYNYSELMPGTVLIRKGACAKSLVTCVNESECFVAMYGGYSFETLLLYFTHIDGTPAGVEESSG